MTQEEPSAEPKLLCTQLREWVAATDVPLSTGAVLALTEYADRVETKEIDLDKLRRKRNREMALMLRRLYYSEMDDHDGDDPTVCATLERIDGYFTMVTEGMSDEALEELDAQVRREMGKPEQVERVIHKLDGVLCRCREKLPSWAAFKRHKEKGNEPPKFIDCPIHGHQNTTGKGTCIMCTIASFGGEASR